MQEYVERREGGYYIIGTRVSLDSVVHLFQKGASPESVLRSFPRIGSLERVYGAITFYLANKQLVEPFLKEQERLADGISQTPLPPSLSEKVRRAREDALRRSS